MAGRPNAKVAIITGASTGLGPLRTMIGREAWPQTVVFVSLPQS